MAKKIIYENDGGVVVVTPADPDLDTAALTKIAHRDIPAGKAFKIIEDTALPADRDFRNAWVLSLPDPDGTSMGRDAYDSANPPS